MRALWVEDHQLIGDSLELLLQVLLPGLSLDKARTVAEAVEWVQAVRYEMVLLDWWIGQHDGASTLKALQAAGCQAPVIVVSGDERTMSSECTQLPHVVACVSKAAEPQQLVAAIERVLGRDQAGACQRPSASAPGSAGTRRQLADLFPELTDRQIDVFLGMVRGLSDKEIARELAIADTTVKTHVRTILQTVGVSKRGQAAYVARQRGGL